MTQYTDLFAKAAAFANDDPDPETRRVIEDAVAEQDIPLLKALFGAPLTFGTAGLRGLLGAGPGRMNQSVVERTTAGLCRHLLQLRDELATTARQPSLCVGFDARHGSLPFAQAATAVARGYGFSVHLFSKPGPTPLLAFAVRHHRSWAGIMITASHNPPAYNGYKVYNSRGAQIAPPDDALISAQIEAVPSVRQLKRLTQQANPQDGPPLPVLPIASSTEEAYLKAINDAIPAIEPHAPLQIAYTPLHGVGGALCSRALTSMEGVTLHPVPSQQAPDPDFPTTPFPNPEETGAMDAVLAVGEQAQADLAFANDPDGDRLAVAARGADGQLKVFNGNELGVLLIDFLLSHHAPAAAAPLICHSVVSTPAARKTAEAHGATVRETLSGFKWIFNTVLEMEANGFCGVFSFEEALGYAVGSNVRDKDGISAAMAVSAMASECKVRQQTLWEYLESVAQRDGCFVSMQHAETRTGADGARAIMNAVDALRDTSCRRFGGLAIASVTDLKRRVITLADGTTREPLLPVSNLILIQLGLNHRICVRPSGTEPKLKMYFDASAIIQPGEDYAAVRARELCQLELIRRDLLCAMGLDSNPISKS